MKWLNTNFPNWQTTVAGLFGAVMAGLYVVLSKGPVNWSIVMLAVGLAATGYFAKGKDVTGGSVPQTPEATTRAEEVDPKATEAAKTQEDVNAPSS